MYTVKELIEALQQCPEDYTIICRDVNELIDYEVYSVGIDTFEKTVDIFCE